MRSNGEYGSSVFESQASWKDFFKTTGVNEADETLLFSAGDHSSLSFNILTARYQEKLYRATFRVLQHIEDAEDATQTALLKIFLKRDHYKKQEGIPFSSWAYKITVNTAITFFRNRRYFEEKFSIPEFDRENEGEGEVSPDVVQRHDLQHDREMKTLASYLLLALMPSERKIIGMFYLENKSYRTICRIEGITISALKIRLFRAREAMKTALQKLIEEVTGDSSFAEPASVHESSVSLGDSFGNEDIAILKLPFPIEKILRQEKKISTIGQLEKYSRDQLIMTRNIDMAALDQIENALHKLGHTLAEI